MFPQNTQSNKPSRYHNALGVDTYRASSGESARAVNWFAGRRRIALSFISDVFEQAALDVTGGSKGASRDGFNYYASLAGLAGCGPVDMLEGIYLNSEPVYLASVEIRIHTLTRTSSTATATMTNAHGLVNNQVVAIVGAEQLEYNGTHTITVTADNQFTFAVSGTPDTPATTDANAGIFARVVLDPVYRDGTHVDCVELTIPDYCVMRLYWGTETQEIDTRILAGRSVLHPAYRGLCYAVFDSLFLGFNQTNVQNIELVVGRYPVPAWDGWVSGNEEINGDANPVSAICDLLQSRRFGFGVADDKIDVTTMLATAATLKSEECGISPLLTRDQEAREAMADWLQSFGGYFSFNSAGQIGIKLVRTPSGTLPEITDSDLVDKPQFNPSDWSEAFNETFVKFTNSTLDFKESMVGRPDTGSRAITGEPKSQTLTFEWITNSDLAELIQTAASRVAALPGITGTMRLRDHSGLFATLPPGAQFTIDYSLRATAHLVFRVDNRTTPDPVKLEFEISFHADRGYLFT